MSQPSAPTLPPLDRKLLRWSNDLSRSRNGRSGPVPGRLNFGTCITAEVRVTGQRLARWPISPSASRATHSGSAPKAWRRIFTGTAALCIASLLGLILVASVIVLAPSCWMAFLGRLSRSASPPSAAFGSADPLRCVRQHIEPAYRARPAKQRALLDQAASLLLGKSRSGPGARLRAERGHMPAPASGAPRYDGFLPDILVRPLLTDGVTVGNSRSGAALQTLPAVTRYSSSGRASLA